MRASASFVCLTALVLALVALPSSAQSLTCPSSAGVSEQDCSLIHYHILVWQPSSRRSYELYGLNQFSSKEVCERARAREEAENKAVVAAIKSANPKSPIQPNRYGPCHCDMTESPVNAYFLDQAKRDAQVRQYEEIRRELRQELLDAGLPTNAPVIERLAAKPSTFRSNLWPKFLPPPPETKVKLLDPDKAVLQDTEASSTPQKKPTISADIKLVDVPTLEGGETPAEGGETPAQTAGEPAVAAVPQTTPGEAFVKRETERVQTILGQSDSLGDDKLKGQIFDALMQRLQALSNLRALVGTAGAKSKLALHLDSASSDDADLALVGLLFGDEVKSHWAPSSAKDAIVTAPDDISNDPVAVLHDTSGRFDEAQRKMALYLVLARNSTLTASDQLWLSQIVESSLE